MKKLTLLTVFLVFSLMSSAQKTTQKITQEINTTNDTSRIQNEAPDTPCVNCQYIIMMEASQHKRDSIKKAQLKTELEHDARAKQKSIQKSKLNNQLKSEMSKSIKPVKPTEPIKRTEPTEPTEEKEASQIKYEILYKEWRAKLKAAARTN